MLKRLIATALFAALGFLAIPLVSMAVYSDPALPAHARAIIILGGDSSDSGAPGPETQARIARGVALWKAGAAPLLVFTGVLTDENERNHAPEIGPLLESLGVPAKAIRVDPNSHSTLQNALFTRDMLGGDLSAPVILVTHRWHLPRGWASFRWAGFTDITLVAADPVKPVARARELAWEILKWPGNILRAGAASALLALGAPEQDVTWFLR